MRVITRQTSTLIMTDESSFSANNARKLLEVRAMNVLNFNLMKLGGILEALKINRMAVVNGIESTASGVMYTRSQMEFSKEYGLETNDTVGENICI